MDGRMNERTDSETCERRGALEGGGGQERLPQADVPALVFTGGQ